MNGAESLVGTLLGAGVDVCFANPGTSEMHFVAALDAHPEMKCILCLFEGGATGAADGYFRMKGDVAATLLHLGPGLANGTANLHNARKAGSGVVTIVGDHASYHMKYESPLKGDLAGIADTVAHWSRAGVDAATVAEDGAAAVRAARSRNGQIATLMLPANTAWEAATGVAPAGEVPVPHRPRDEAIVAVARRLREPGAALLLGGAALHGALAQKAGQIAGATGCRLFADYLVPRMRRGAGAVAIEHLKYPVEENVATLRDVSCLVLCGAERPVSFFAYPGKPGVPEQPDCAVLDLCDPDMDITWTLDALLTALGGGEADVRRRELDLPGVPAGDLTVEAVAAAIAVVLPEEAILVDESITIAGPILAATETARAHDWLAVTGGAIGFGLPAAVGAAVACPERRVVVLTGDGSAMYTLQSLWTMARERLNVTVVVFANQGYRILHRELVNVGVMDAGRNAQRMFDMVDPEVDWVALAKGHGVTGIRVENAEGLVAALREGVSREGPYLIEVSMQRAG